jgi:hypothetical protein
MAQPREEIQQLLRPHALRRREVRTGQGLPDRGEQLAPIDGHADPHRQQKAGADGLPGPIRGQAPAGDQTVHVRMQDQRLAPGV